MVTEIMIYFWEKTIDENIEVLSFSSSSFPSYNIGQKIFLEFNCHPFVPEKFKKDEIKLTEYEIVDIHHSIRQTLSNQPTIEIFDEKTHEIPFSYHTHTTMDVYVQKTPKTPWDDEK